jgi:hypothetical protein
MVDISVVKQLMDVDGIKPLVIYLVQEPFLGYQPERAIGGMNQE